MNELHSYSGIYQYIWSLTLGKSCLKFSITFSISVFIIKKGYLHVIQVHFTYNILTSLHISIQPTRLPSIDMRTVTYYILTSLHISIQPTWLQSIDMQTVTNYILTSLHITIQPTWLPSIDMRTVHRAGSLTWRVLEVLRNAQLFQQLGCTQPW